MIKKENLLLKCIMSTIYENKRSLPEEPLTVVRHEIADGRAMCEVWFMTEGCAYDKEGGCTMCNYGKGHKVDEEMILARLKQSFQELPDSNYNLVINPSGSFLDEREVCSRLRLGIYELLDHVSFESLTVESRADVITESLLRELRNRYPDKRVSVEIGVETLDAGLLRNSVNKGVFISDIEAAVEKVHSAGLRCVANIGLGLPFVSEKANMNIACQSVQKALKIGFDAVILFPYHIKPGTLLEVLYKAGRYQCVSLWALIEVLAMLPQECLPVVNISWYRNYYTDKTKILSSPCTCSECQEAILALLDKYKSEPCKDTLAALEHEICSCRNSWKDNLKGQADCIEYAMFERDYRFLARYFHMDTDLLEEALREVKESLYAVSE